ncbi:MAG TPA: hypothetical protein VHK64_05430, partial [Nocardioidaceae bacterium]|nr:hypothetical protein [Nocardioidaceae bacterium]
DMKKFAEATKDMAPAMQDALKSVVGFKPQIDDLKKTVQGNFWGQFTDQIKPLVSGYLPIMKQGLGAIATQLGMTGRLAMAAAQNPLFKGAIAGIVNNTAAAVKNMAPALGNVLTGFVRIGVIGSNYLPALGKAITDVTLKFRLWANDAVKSGKLEQLIDGAIQGFKDLGGIVSNVGSILASVFTGLGGVVESPLARIRELTGQVAEFLKTAAAQDGLRALGETLQVVGDVVGKVVMTALKELAPTLVSLAPVAQEVARTLGDLLIGALETVGPLIRGVADVFNAFPGAASVATVAVVGFVAAIRTIRAVNAVTDLLGMESVFARCGASAETAGGKVGRFGGALGLLRGALAVGAVAAIAVEMDQVNVAAAGGAENLQGFERNLHNIVGAGEQLASGDIPGIIRDIGAQVAATNDTWKAGQAPVQQWSLSVGRAASDAAISMQNFFRGLVGLPPLPPLKLDVDPTTGQAKVADFVGGVSRTRGTAQLDADASRGNAVLGGWKGSASATVGTAHLNAESGQANSTRAGWQGAANGTVGTAHLHAEPGQANAALGGWRGSANATVGTAHLNANTSSATSAVNSWRAWASGIVVTVRAVLQRIGFAGGGPVLPGMADGGPITGPGSGTSDQAGMFALSAGEWVMTAKQVQNAGGFAGMARLSAALEKGHLLGLAGGGGIRANARAAMRTPTPAPAGGSSGGTVVQFAGNTSDALATVIMQMIRTNKIQIKAA